MKTILSVCFDPKLAGYILLYVQEEWFGTIVAESLHRTCRNKAWWQTLIPVNTCSVGQLPYLIPVNRKYQPNRVM